MKHLVLKNSIVLEVHDTYAEAWGALVHLRASSIETVSDIVAARAKVDGHYPPSTAGYVLQLDEKHFYPRLHDKTI